MKELTKIHLTEEDLSEVMRKHFNLKDDDDFDLTIHRVEHDRAPGLYDTSITIEGNKDLKIKLNVT